MLVFFFSDEYKGRGDATCDKDVETLRILCGYSEKEVSGRSFFKYN